MNTKAQTVPTIRVHRPLVVLTATLLTVFSTPGVTASAEKATAVGVVDATKIVVQLDGREETVQLIGVELPAPRVKEMQDWFDDSLTLATELVEGKHVLLERDDALPDRDDKGSLLRYVYLDDGTLVNTELIAAGYAHCCGKCGFSMRKDFREASRQPYETNRSIDTVDIAESERPYAPSVCGVSTPVSITQPDYEKSDFLKRLIAREEWIMLEHIIRADGSVSDITASNAGTFDSALVEKAVAFLEQHKFEPALLNGKPVSVYWATQFNGPRESVDSAGER